jgi:ribosome-binding factor A
MSRRIERVNELLRQEVSQLICRELKDPRLALIVTVTEVNTSADLSAAKVFISVMGTPKEKEEALTSLTAAGGFFRKELASRLSMRRVPELIFRRDDSIERGAHLLELLDRVAAEEGGQKGKTRS